MRRSPSATPEDGGGHHAAGAHVRACGLLIDMRILTRYLLKSHIGPFLFALVTLTGILFVNTIARRFEELAGKGLPVRVILEVFVLSLPHILALTLPMAVLVATLYAFSQLAADNEITALKAGGINLVRVIMPLLVVATMFAFFMLWFNDRVLPDSNNRLKGLMADVAAKTPTLTLQENVINQIQTRDYRAKYWIRPGRIDDETRTMHDVVIFDLSNPRNARTVYADSGRMALNPQQTDLMLTLFDGVVHESAEQNPTELQRVAFREQRIEMKGIGTELQRSTHEYRSDREMSVAMLQEVVDSARARLITVRQEGRDQARNVLEGLLAGPERRNIDLPPSAGIGLGAGDVNDVSFERRRMAMSDADDVMYRAALDAQRIANNASTERDRMNQYLVELHKKFAIPFACIIFVLIGAPLAVRFPRGGVGMVIAASLAIFGIYYTSLIGGESLGDRGTIDPFWGPWAPNLLFGILSLFALSRIGRETATSRGGGMDDIWIGARTFFTGRWLRRRRSADRQRARARTPVGDTRSYAHASPDSHSEA